MNNITPQVALDAIPRVGLKILSAAALFVVGRWLINLALALTQKALQSQHLDAPIVR